MENDDQDYGEQGLWSSIVEELDLDGDGRIDYHEF